MANSSTRLLIALLLASLNWAQNTQPDFRKVAWGMTQAQVMATEPDRPDEVTQTNGEVIVKYGSVAAAELSDRVIYIFINDKLVRAKSISNANHSDPNDFIADFRAAEPALMEKYGKPDTERAVWDNDLYQQERLPYLDQDRALASDILPSDQHAGLSVSLGYLRLYTQRHNARTKIVHALTGENSRITHQIEYRSVELEPLENKVLQRGASGDR
jgi:hypothetical protein